MQNILSWLMDVAFKIGLKGAISNDWIQHLYEFQKITKQNWSAIVLEGIIASVTCENTCNM